MSLFTRRSTVTGAPVPDETAAYEEGRLDERRTRPVAAGTADPAVAYDRGRADERHRRRRGGFGLGGLLLLILVVVGAVMLYLAIRNGSFSQGGAVVDHGITTVTQKAEAPIRGAADKAGSALQNAGTNLKQSAGTGGQ
ncbi:MAG: hypothetical protein JOZ27_00450 [Caulobacteraceae bacterium]|nr:hypothetical protein [Caulobacteraceae bacterium]